MAIPDEFRRRGLDPGNSSLRIGIFGADPWSNAMRREIEQGFAIDAVDIYGLSEVIGPGVANDCVETKDGPTIREDHFSPEVINPDTGAVLPEGELVFTSLTKEAVPVIRYRARDLTRLLPVTAHTMWRMEKITGRSDDMLIIRGVNLFPAQIEPYLLQSPMLCPHYRLVPTREGRMDEVTVEVEAHAHVDEAVLEEEARVITTRIKDTVDLSMQVAIQPTRYARAFAWQGAACGGSSGGAMKYCLGKGASMDRCSWASLAHRPDRDVKSVQDDARKPLGLAMLDCADDGQIGRLFEDGHLDLHMRAG